jgi:hypothetical protein
MTEVEVSAGGTEGKRLDKAVKQAGFNGAAHLNMNYPP